MIDLSTQHRNQLKAVAGMIGEDLAQSWNYIGILEAMQVHAKRNRKLFLTHSHFISTFVYAAWDSLFLKLHHCIDRQPKACGFPKLFKLTRKYLPKEKDLLRQVKADEQILGSDKAVEKIANWRNQMVAHFTLDDEAFREFYKANQCQIEELKPVITKFQEMLNHYSLILVDMGFRPDDMTKNAFRSVDEFVAKLEQE